MFRDLSRTLGEILERDVPSAVGDGKSIPRLVDALRHTLARIPDDDPLSLHELSTNLAVLLFSLHRDAEAGACLHQAESLEALLGGELPKLRRKVVLARRQAQLGKVLEARALFAELLPMADRLMAGSERLALLTEYLVALRPQPEPACDQVLDLSQRGRRLFAELLDASPSAAGRRRVRDVHQRFFEAALLALLSSAKLVGEDSESGQGLLAVAWSLVMVGRNPELRAARPAPEADALRSLRRAEDALHRALREAAVLPDPTAEGGWKERLEELSEVERMLVRAPRLSEAASGSQPALGVALAFFEVRDLSAAKALFVLGSYQGRFSVRVVPRKVWGPLIKSLRGVSKHFELRPISVSDLARERAEELERPLQQLLPQKLALLVVRKPAAIRREESSLEAPLFSIPWFLFPERPLSRLPLEMFREGLDRRPFFGEGRAIHLCLRPMVRSACTKPVDFSKGWLGVGAVPAAGRFKRLDASQKEVQALWAALRGWGYRAWTLTSGDATASALRAQLLLLRPAVLHFAVHGWTDPKVPDACSLILAPAPGLLEGELLPFRRIRDLDLSGVALVVLSACKSLLGRSGRGGGIEGLAWAFLQAGAAQVIASRYPVDDEATAQIMAVLYRHLQSHPVAEALGRTRAECLNELGMDPHDVAAWSVWI